MRAHKPSRTAMMVAYWRTLAALGLRSVPHEPDRLARRLLRTRQTMRDELARAGFEVVEDTGLRE